MQDNTAVLDGAEAENETELYSRREAIALGAGAAVTLATAGTGVVSAETDTEDYDEVKIDYDSDLAHVPRINGTATVTEHGEGFAALEYVADDGEVSSLEDDGFVIAKYRGENGDETPWNPVTISAADFYQENDDGNRERLDEFAAFPRGATYDDDADTDTDEVGVSVLDAEHWTTTGATNGTVTVENVANDSLRISTASVATGETVTAAFDLSTVASEDATIKSGIARKFIQAVMDVDALPTGVLVEVALVDSAGAEVVATLDPAGDVATEAVLANAVGDSQVGQARVGELGAIEDIQTVEIRVSETDADVTFHAFNAERESLWVFGKQEVTDTNDDGETILETEDVEQPSGAFAITDLGSIPSPFSSAALAAVEYDVEVLASELPSEQTLARTSETPDTYDRPIELEVVHEFEAPTAYTLGIDFGNMLDETLLPNSRYQAVEVATGVSEIEEWDDVDDVSFTSRTSDYSTVGDDVELYSTVAASDRTAYRLVLLLENDEADDVTRSGGVGAVAVGGGGGGGFGGFGSITVIMGILAGIGIWFRKAIMGVAGR